MHTVDITTTQSVTIEYNLATLRERFLALLVDLVVIVFIGIAINTFLSFRYRDDKMGGTISTFLNVLYGGGLMILYNLLCESILNGQTIGKKVLNTKVVRVDGKPVTFSDLMIRAMMIIIDYYYCIGIIGAILISSNDKKQRLGDMAAGTTVIKTHSDKQFSLYDILNINTLENYTPLYPQVRNLTEEDMLLIKSSIIRYQKYPNGSHTEAMKVLVLHVCKVLDIAQPRVNEVEFLKTLLKDYIVLTR
jgi:uncharacterized RDD family membrane protein YckC